MSRAGTGARDQVARLLTLVPLLHSRNGLNLGEAAHLLGTTPEQVRKDLKVLWMCGLPGGLTDDLIDVDMEAFEEEGLQGVIHVSNADYLSRPVRLSATEATALVVALRAVRDSSPEETRAIVDTLIAKLEVAASSERSQVAVAPTESEASPIRATLEHALEVGSQVRLTYWVPSRDEVGERVVDPLRLAAVNGVDYLEAWCHRAEDTRVFRIDRMEEVELLHAPAGAHPNASSEPLSVALFTSAPEATTVTLRLAHEARWVPEYYPVEDVRHLGDGVLDVDLKVVDVGWLQQLVLRLAPHARVVGPADVAATVHRTAVDTLTLYT
ncbi:helix-turn-helix transcriptional regulator [Nocardioides jishulii]|uniref:WYL domain-containing protein n=1 Tax=Nocardioides jishulii TaxID=2575440 RepID=A0A4U2YQY0_9ACTN|nr:WYL domain-containing protein [Nocardioides jishulii]QCX27554.1 WYL domain-containing protein [Nocardioides jishulii]TKI62361.1 WYL domain-containing protein [Nocardioides jishulii]